MATASHKSSHYAQVLRDARLSGSWTTPGPPGAKDAAGSVELSWSEVFRKWAKYRPDEKNLTDLLHAEYALRSSLPPLLTLLGYGDRAHINDSARGRVALPPIVPSPDNDFAVPAELGRITGGGDAGGDTTEQGETAGVDKGEIRRLAEAVEKARVDLEALSVRVGADVRAGWQQQISVLLSLAFFAQGRDRQAIDVLSMAGYDLQSSEPVRNQAREGRRKEEGRVEVEEAGRVMGWTVLGMAHERLTPLGNASSAGASLAPRHPALLAYSNAVALSSALYARTGKTPTLSTSADKSDPVGPAPPKASGAQAVRAGELEAWTELALYRRALGGLKLGSRKDAVALLREYIAHASARLPPGFRPSQRCVILRTFVRVLCDVAERGQYEPPDAAAATAPLASRTDGVTAGAAIGLQVTPPTPTNTQQARARSMSDPPHPHPSISNALSPDMAQSTPFPSSESPPSSSPLHPRSHVPLPPAAWYAEVCQARVAWEALVHTLTPFPRAGRVNREALRLVEGRMREWEVGGESPSSAPDAIALLQRAERLTFQSHRVQRYLTVLFTSAGEYAEARRAMGLYVQMVDKARETGVEEVARAVREGEGREDVNKIAITIVDGPGEAGQSIPAPGLIVDDRSGDVGADTDPNEQYVPALLFGARLMVKYVGDADEGESLVAKAAVIVDSAGDEGVGADKTLVARVRRMQGVVATAKARSENDPTARQRLHDSAVSYLQESTQLDPHAAETHYHLAHLLSSMHDLPAALKSVRKALELRPLDLHAWHLLTLLLTAQKDYKGARDVADVALDDAPVFESGLDAPIAKEDVQKPPGAGAVVANGGTPPPGTGLTTPAVNAHQMCSIDYPARPEERREAVCRLMMLRATLTEVLEGPDAAVTEQKEVFQYYHEKIAGAPDKKVPQRPAAAAAPPPVPAYRRTLSLTRRISGDAVSLPGLQRSGTPDSSPTARQQQQQQPPSLVVEGPPSSGGSQRNKTLGTSIGSHLSLNRGHSGGRKSAKERLGSFRAPSVGRHMLERSASIASNASSIQSRKPRKPLRRASAPVPPPTPPVPVIRTLTHLGPLSSAGEAPELSRRDRRERRLLVELWLMSAATFRRAGKMDECKAAVQEAERVDPEDADVWVQLALYHAALGDTSTAMTSLYKALALSSEHVAATVHLARLCLTSPSIPSTLSVPAALSKVVGSPTSPAKELMVLPRVPASSESELVVVTRDDGGGGVDGGHLGPGSESAPAADHLRSKSAAPTPAPASTTAAQRITVEQHKAISALSIAEGLLNSLTAGPEGQGCPDAWYWLAKVHERTERKGRARECLKYALRLEEVRPIRAWEEAEPCL